jgi:hypothetical protein
MTRSLGDVTSIIIITSIDNTSTVTEHTINVIEHPSHHHTTNIIEVIITVIITVTVISAIRTAIPTTITSETPHAQVPIFIRNNWLNG